MLFAVGDLPAHLQIADRTAEQIQVGRQDGGSKDQRQADAVLLKYVGCGKSGAVHRDLLHGGNRFGAVSADHTVILAVDRCHGGNDIGTVGPVHRIGIGKPVGLRPHVEIRIYGDQGVGWCSQFHNNLLLSGTENYMLHYSKKLIKSQSVFPNLNDFYPFCICFERFSFKFRRGIEKKRQIWYDI